MKRFCHTILTSAAFAVLTASVANASTAGQYNLERSQKGDIEKSCSEISAEIHAMEDIMRESVAIQEAAYMRETGFGVAKTVGSFLVGTLGGAVGIFAAGYVLNEATDDDAEFANKTWERAVQRRSFMVGIFDAKGCAGPLRLASIEPASGDQDFNFPEDIEHSQEPHYNE